MARIWPRWQCADWLQCGYINADEAIWQTQKAQSKEKPGSARAPPGTKLSVSETFEDKIQFWYQEGKENGVTFVLGSTGETLQGLGAIESDIYMTGDKIRAILEDHPEMTINEIKRIPEILDDPVLVLKSKNKARSQYGNSRLVVFGGIKGTDGLPIMCVLDLRPTENGLILDDMQKVTSAYTKDKKPVDFVQSSFVMHVDKKRTIPLLRTIGFRMPITLQRSGSIGSIIYKGEKVNLQGEKLSDVVQLGEQQKENNRETVFSAAEQDGQEQGEARYVTNARNDLLRDLQSKTGIPFVWGAELPYGCGGYLRIVGGQRRPPLQARWELEDAQQNNKRSGNL